MKNTQIENLLNIQNNAEHFHEQFEKLYKSPQHFRKIFNNDVFLWGARKAFLYEVYASNTTLLSEKIGFFLVGIELLEKLSHTTSAPVETLYAGHYLAKFYYQLGVAWTEAHTRHHTNLVDFLEPIENWMYKKNLTSTFLFLKSSKKKFLQLARESYEKGVSSYDRIKTQLNVESPAAFSEKAYALYAPFQELDQYSPCARLVSLYCNLYLCSQEDDTAEISNADLINHLSLLLGVQQNKPTTSTTESQDETSTRLSVSQDESAIQHVKELLYAELGLQPPHNLTQPSRSDHKAPHKRQRTTASEKSTRPKTIDWSPTIHNRQDLTKMLQQPWVAPNFLRDSQKEYFKTIVEALKYYEKPLIITLATGLGKTAVFSSVMSQALHNKLSTIIIVPTNDLAKQTRDKLIEYQTLEGMGYRIDYINVYCPTENMKEIGPTTIVTQSSYNRQVKNATEKFPTRESLMTYIQNHPQACFESEVFFHPERFALLIVDEGHHVVGQKLYQTVSNPAFAHPTLLFSASTLPGEYKEIDQLGTHLITRTLQEGIESQELAPVQMITIDFSMYGEAKNLTRMLSNRLKNRDTLDKESKDLIEKLLIEQSGFSLTALSVLIQTIARAPYSGKTMVFTDSIQHAELLATLLNRLTGKMVRAYHSKTTDRQAVMAQFKQDEKAIIVAVGALDEGFDETQVKFILDCSIYVGRLRRLYQRLGRALRRRPDGSGAILLSVKLLGNNLQRIARDELINDHEKGYIGLQESELLNETTLSLTLPAELSFSDTDDNDARVITPHGAKIMFPHSRKLFTLGCPPEDAEQNTSTSSKLHTARKKYTSFFSLPSLLPREIVGCQPFAANDNPELVISDKEFVINFTPPSNNTTDLLAIGSTLGFELDDDILSIMDCSQEETETPREGAGSSLSL